MRGQPRAPGRDPKGCRERHQQRADDRPLPGIGDDARRQVRKAVEEIGCRPHHQQLVHARKERGAQLSGRHDLQALDNPGMPSDQPAQVTNPGPVGHDQIAGRAVFLGELERDVPRAAAQIGDGEPVGNDQPVRINRRGMADTDFIGQCTVEGALLDQA